ncbi:MAG: tetratricopeptide repeat protein [Acidobacteriota bacterium]|nr:MAG: tetratricopeptide repeat protein [Acidobacteriota bacterium]
MNRSRLNHMVASGLGLLLLAAFVTAGCQYGQQTSVVEPEKMPVTTASEQAREEYIRGRDLFEKLRFTDAREHYAKAVELDPDFALAHLGMANTSPTATEFWNSLEAAVTAADKASEGERHFVLAADAGTRGKVAAQKEHLDRLAEMFPDDERVHNAIGQYYFGRQDYAKAVEHYDKAASLNADFSQPYNQLGYAHRFMNNYDSAEKAFKKYIELIPDEPNPYDSFAELLMKTGRWEESIQNYELALEKNPNFIASYIGIGNNQMFMGQGEQARETFGKLLEVARNDGERRQALFWTANSYIHEGDIEAALEALDERYAIAAETKDLSTPAGDLVLIGNVLLEAGRADQALAKYDAALETMDRSDALGDNKDNFRRNHLYRAARVSLAKGELNAAEQAASDYGKQVGELGIPFEIRQHHELLGMIALKRKDHDTAIEHLEQANQQNPRVLYLTALAHKSAGNADSAREMCERAARFNGLNFNYAFVRGPALEMLEKL